MCTYLGTIKGEKLNEPESDLSPICQKKNTARMDSACRAPTGLQGSGGGGERDKLQARKQ